MAGVEDLGWGGGFEEASGSTLAPAEQPPEARGEPVEASGSLAALPRTSF